MTTDETDEEEEERCYDDKQTFNEQRGVVKPVEVSILMNQSMAINQSIGSVDRSVG